MTPIKFPEVNATYAKDQPEYKQLPVFKDSGPEGAAISCWQLTFKERLRILFTGKLWVSLWTFHKPLTPSQFTTKKSDVLICPKKQKYPKLLKYVQQLFLYRTAR